MPSSRFLLSGGLRRPLIAGLLGGALLMPFVSVFAAPRAPVAAPAVAPAPTPAPPTAPAINILLVPIDELPAPVAIGTAGAPPAPPAPDLPALAPAPGAITPASWNEAGQTLWRAQAQKRNKKEKEDDLFKLEPDPRALLPKSGAPASATTRGATTAGVPAPADAGIAVTGIAPVAAPGSAQQAAVPLRRALLNLGWGDVLPAALDSTSIARAIGERRLTSRSLDALRQALAPLAAPGATPNDAQTQRAARAAARIGQALGYRAVVAFTVAPSTARNGAQNAAFSFLLCDSARESGEALIFDEHGATDDAMRDAGALIAAALLDKSLRAWPPVAPANRTALAQKHFEAARAFIAQNDAAGAQDELVQAIALDGSRGELYVALGDLLAATDAVGAVGAYRRAVQLNARDGVSWAKIAATYTQGTPDWPRALEAGRQALATGYDSAALRVTMATAQFGRADLFRRAERIERAEDAELEARQHLDRALELAPDDPSALRLLTTRLIASRRFDEAAQILDRVAPRYPKDLEIQTQYAAALVGQSGREEDAFVASARVWRLSSQRAVTVDAIAYRSLSQGFDTRVYNIGKSAVQLTAGVATNAVPREDALLQLTKLQEDMNDAQNAVTVLRAPSSVAPSVGVSRQFAAALMTQALERFQQYLETGDDLQRVRGAQLNAQAVAQLNTARTAR